MKIDSYASARTKVIFNKKSRSWALLDKQLGIQLVHFDKPSLARSAKRSWWFYLMADNETSMKHLRLLENGI